LKLFVPFVFGTLFIAPILSYMADKINCGYGGGVLYQIAKLNTEKTPLWTLVLIVLLAFAAYPLQVAGKSLLTYLLFYLLGFYVFGKQENIVKTVFVFDFIPLLYLAFRLGDCV